MSRLRQSPPAQKLKKMLFLLGSRGPANRWYGGYKLDQLMQSMGKPFCEDQLPAGYGRWIDERIVEFPWLISRLPEGSGHLLDAGSVLNQNFMINHPKLRDKNITIMTLAPEPECYWLKGVSYVYGDLRNTIFRDKVFDFVVNISTLEHVGLDNQRFHSLPLTQKAHQTESYLLAVRELARVLKPGGVCFISVPFGRRVVEEWMQIFDAEMVDRVVHEFGPTSYSATYFRYSGESGWKACDKMAAADARYFNFKTDTPWQGHPAAAEAVVCLELKK